MQTSLYAAILAIMLVLLSINVIRSRRRFGAAIGDGNHIEIKRRIRAQGNLAEYAPLFLVLLGMAEHQGFPAYGVHALGMFFLAGRLMHAYSLLKHEQYEGEKLTANPVWRIRGMICTFNTLGLLAVILLTQWILHF